MPDKDLFAYLEGQKLDPKTNLPEESTEPEEDIFQRQTVTKESGPVKSTRVGDIDEYEAYLGKGNAFMGSPGLDKARAQAQPWYEQAGAFLNQAVIGEIVGGTLEGIGYLFDFPEIVETMQGENKEWGNWLSDIGQDLKQWADEATPIYQENPGEWNPLDSGWWFKNGVSVASTLSLLIPATGVVKGASMLGKFANVGKNMGKTAKWMTKGVGTAVVSRHMENMMEASGVFNESYQKIKDEINPATGKKFTDDEARSAAADGAHSVYAKNWAMLMQDIPQYLLLMRGPKLSNSITSAKVAKAAGKSVGNVRWLQGYNAIKDMASEGIEEAYQYIVGEEGKHIAEQAAGIGDDSEFSDRLGEYVTDGEFWTSAFFGAIGAGVTQTAGKGIHRLIDKGPTLNDLKVEEIQNRDKIYAFYNKQARQAEEAGNPEAAQFMMDNLNMEVAIKAAKLGNLDLAVEMLENMKNATPEEMEAFNFSPEQVEKVDDYIADMKKVGNLYQKAARKFDGPSVDMIVRNQFLGEKLSAKKTEVQREVEDLERGKEAGIGGLTPTGRSQFKTLNNIAGAEKAVKAAEFKLKKMKSKPGSKRHIAATNNLKNANRRLKYHQKKLDTLNKEEINPDDKANDDAILRTIFTDDLDSKQAELYILEDMFMQTQEDLQYYSDPKNQEEIKEKAKAAEEKAKDAQAEELKKEQANAKTDEERQAAQAKADKAGVADKVKKKVDDETQKQKKEAPKVAFENIGNALRERYEGKDALKQSEAEELKDYIEADESIEDGVKDSVAKDPNIIDSLIQLFDAHIPGLDEPSALEKAVAKFFKFYNDEKDRDANENTAPPQDDNSSEDNSKENANKPNPDEGVSENVKSAPFTTVGHQMKLEKDKDTKKWRPVPGLPQESDQLDPRIDQWDRINDPDNFGEGTEVEFIVDLKRTQELMDEKKISDPVKQGVIYVRAKDKNGVDTIIGKLQSTLKPTTGFALDTLGYKALKELREKAISPYVKDNQLTSQEETIETGLTTTIDAKFPGFIHNTETWQNPKSVVKGDPMLGIAIEHSDGALALHIPNIKGAEEAVYVTAENLSKGHVYVISKAANGSYIPLRAFTRKLSDMTNTYAEVVELIKNSTPQNWTTNKEVVRQNVALDYEIIFEEGAPASIKLYEKVEGEGRKEIPGSETNIEDIDKLLEDKMVQIDERQLNKGSYNELILNEEGKDGREGRLEMNVKPYIHSHSAGFKLATYKEKGDPVTKDPEQDVKVVENTNSVKDSEIREPAKRTRPKRVKKTKGLPTPNLIPEPKKRVKSGPFTKWSEEEEVAWFKKNLPNVPISVIENMKQIYANGKEDAWGMFYNASVYIHKNAATGTAYHEAFHAVFNLFLGEKQKQALLVEAQAKIGSNNELELEEYLAERFREFVQTDGTDTSGGNAITKFFKDLLAFIKSIFTGSLPMEMVFERINTGKYAQKKPIKSSTFANPLRYRVPGFDPYEEQDRLAFLDTSFWTMVDHVRNNEPDMAWKSDFDIIREKGLPALYDMVYESLDTFLETSNNEDVNEKIERFLEWFVEIDEKGRTTSLKAFATKHAEQLVNYGIKINLSKIEVKGTQSEEEAEVNEELDNKENWMVDSITRNGKDTLSFEVRKMLRRLVKLDKEGDPATDDIGQVQYMDFHTIYNTLERGLSEIYEPNAMMLKLATMVEKTPELAQVVAKLENDKALKAAFYSNFAKKHNKYTMIVEKRIKGGEGYSYQIINSGRVNLDSMLIDEWKSNLRSTVTNKVTDKSGNIILDKAKAVLKEYIDLADSIKNNKRALDASVYQEVSDILAKAGITLSPEEIATEAREIKTERLDIKPKESFIAWLYSSGKRDKGAKKILEHMAKANDEGFGSNPYGIPELNQAFKSITRTAIASRLDLYQSSLQNVERKTVYSYVLPNFMSRFVEGMRDPKMLDHYLKDRFYSKSPWLQALKERQGSEEIENKQIWDIALLDGFRKQDQSRGTKYSGMSEYDIETVKLSAYLNQGANTALYAFPILADAPAMPFIRFDKYTGKEVLDKLVMVAEQEMDRMAFVEADIKNPNTKTVKNYHERGRKFVVLPFLNKLAKKDRTPAKIRAAISDHLLNPKTGLVQRHLDKFSALGIIAQNEDKTYRAVRGLSNNVLASKYDGSVRAAISSYVFNSYLANTQMTTLFSGDSALYANAGDFNKRNKQANSPISLMDTTVLGADKQNYNTVYLTDQDRYTSKSIATIASILKDAPNIPAAEKEQLINMYRKTDNPKDGINVTDAQAYITLERYRDIKTAMGQWPDSLEMAYEAVQRGEASDADLNAIFNPVKPFYFGHTEINGAILATQNKNSEMVLIPQLVNMEKDGKLLFPKLKEYHDRMALVGDYAPGEVNNKKGELEKVDSVQFVSAVKVGEHSVNDNAGKPSEWKHVVLRNKDYGVQQPTPAHYIDDETLIGTQIRKLIISDLFDKIQYSIKGSKPLNKEELVALYQNIIGEDLRLAYKDVRKRFDNKKEIRALIEEEIKDRGLGDQLLEAVQLIDGDFALPLFHQLHGNRVESLLNSVFKNKIIKQKIKGGSFIQASSFGYAGDLDIVYNDDKSIKHFECLLPWWSKKYLPTNENGEVDFAKIEAEDPSILELIGFRIPTEDKYSMAPLKVVGFTPKEAGGIIMLPPEITSIAGSDFDVDKMYVMMPEFEVSEDGENIRKVEYDYSKSPEDQPGGQAARNNAKIDIMRSILTNKEHAHQMLAPGTFQNLKDIKDDILKWSGLDKVDDLDINDPLVQTEFFLRNVAGASLIGIFANQNVNHAVTQYGGLAFSHKMEPVRFKILNPATGEYEKREFTSLNNTLGEDGKAISRSLASFLAASVDNAKDPIFSFLNINTHNADVVSLLIRLGIPEKVALTFIAQPILRKFASRYANMGSERMNEGKIINDLTKEYSEQLKDKDKYDTQSLWSLNPEDLESWIKKSAKQDYNDYYFAGQLAVLRTFEDLLSKSNTLTSFIQATRVDSKGNGPRMADNEAFIRRINKVKETKALPAAGAIFGENSAYPMVADFTTYGLELPTKVLQEYFPFMTPAFERIKDQMEYMKNRDLTADEINFINYQLLSYITSGFETFQDPEGTKRNYAFNNLAVKIKEEMLKDEKFSNNALISRLILNGDTISFNNGSGMSNEERNKVAEHWEELLVNGTDVQKSIARGLVQYNFFSGGLNFTPESFAHLIPVKYWTDLASEKGIKYNDYLKSVIETSKANKFTLDAFTEQFVRNHFQRLSYVPEITTKETRAVLPVTAADDKINPPVSFSIEIADPANSAFVVDDEEAELGVIGKPYLKMTHNTEHYLYKRAGLSSNYVLIPRLGKPNQEIEYSFGQEFYKTKNPDNYVKIAGFPMASADIGKGMGVVKSKGKNLEDYYFQDSYEESLMRPFLDVAEETTDESVTKEKESIAAPKEDKPMSKEDMLKALGSNTRGESAEDVMLQVKPASEEARNEELDDKLKAILSTYGITVETVNNMKERLGVDAVGAAIFVQKAILVAEGKARIDTLPEEAAHMFIEMLGDNNPLVMRLVALAKKSDSYAKTYEEYKERYDNNEDLIAKEHAGKLLGQAMVNKFNSEDTGPKTLVESIKATIKRLLNKVMSMFRKGTTKEIQDQIDATFGKVAEQALAGELEGMDVKNLKKSKAGVFYQLDINTLEDFSSAVIRSMETRLANIERRGEEEKAEAFRSRAKKIKRLLDRKKEKAGLDAWFTSLNDDLEVFQTYIEEYKDNPKGVTFSPRRVREMQNFLTTNEELLSTVTSIVQFDRELSEEYAEWLPQIKNLEGAMAQVRGLVNRVYKDTVLSVLDREKMGDYDPNTIFEDMKSDINGLAQYFGTLKSSKIEELRIVYNMLSEARIRVNQQLTPTINELKDLHLAAEEKGFKFESLRERDSEGNITGYIVSPYKYGEFFAYKAKFIQDLAEKLGYENADEFTKDDLTVDQLKIWKAEWKKFNLTNYVSSVSEKDGVPVYKKKLADKWKNKEFESIVKSSPEAEAYYNKLMEINDNQRAKLPKKYRQDRFKYMLPQIRKDVMERLRAGEGTVWNNMKEIAKESFTPTEIEDETAFGDKSIVKDIEGNIIKLVPIHFTAPLNDMKNLSGDITSMFVAFADMATSFYEKARIADDLEIIRQQVGERKVDKGRQSKGKRESNAFDMLSSFLDMHLYGQEKAKQTFNFLGKEWDLTGPMDSVNAYVRRNNLAFNLFTTIAGFAKGSMDSKLEDIVGLYTTNESKLWAEGEFDKQILKVMAEVGKRKQTSKMHMIFEKNNLFRSNVEIARDMNLKDRPSRVLNSDLLYSTYSMADYRMKGKMALAIYNNYRLIDGKFMTWSEYKRENPDTQKSELKTKWKDATTLYDAYEFDGTNMKVKDEYTKEVTKELEVLVNKKLNHLSAQIDGRLNPLDKAKIHQNVFGRALMIHRGWMVSGIENRFKVRGMNYETGEVEEGYYRVITKALTNMIKTEGSLKQKLAVWNTLDEVDKRNALRLIADLSFIAATAALAYILNNMADDDDDWMAQYLAYQSNRILLESKAFVSPTELFALLKSPAAGVNQLNSIKELLSALIDFEDIERGPYEGKSRLERIAIKRSFLKNFYELQFPGDKNKYLESQL